ncbi:MAG: 2-octaprenyl-6-methoxyphenol hydroxylase [Candidatus Deianiraeaceae bacterium]|jgi:2-octaprenyl-6-methoxyphenol hydroxylase
MAEVAVIGSGLNGLAMAYGLVSCGISVKVFEENTFGGKFQEDTRTSFISHNSLNFLTDFTTEVISKSGIIQEIYSFKNEGNSIVELASDNMGYVVDNAHLKKVMITYLTKHPLVEIVENTTVKKIFNHNDGIKINDENFQIAICGSGANSSIHKKLGIEQEVLQYSQTAFVFDIKHEMPHKNIAVEAFDETGIIATLPKKQENFSSVILSLKDKYASKLQDKSVLEFLQAKTQRFRNLGAIIEITSNICRHPLSMKYMTKQQYKNIFFIGDAFHSIHPVLGQGFNMSVKDIIHICAKLSEAKKLGIPYHQSLPHLAKKNIANHIKMGLATHIFGKAFISKKPIVHHFTSASIAVGSVIPAKLKTLILKKLL